METNLFPHIYNQQVDSRTNERINQARSRYSSCVNSINQGRTSKPDESRSIWGWILGIAGGFVPCTCVTLDTPGLFEFDVGSGLGVWFIFAAACGFIGWLVNLNSISSYERNEAEIASRISHANEDLTSEIQKIQQEAELDKQRYLSVFESNVQNMSVRFVESEQAKEVIDWMIDGFTKTIDYADRRAHVEQIVVPFQFNVYAHQITCNLGAYDFKIHRCARLNSPLEQAALTRAIASAIQLNITMKYPQDIGGMTPVIDIGYSYAGSATADLHVSVTVTYTAPNGNYRSVTDW